MITYKMNLKELATEKKVALIKAGYFVENFYKDVDPYIRKIAIEKLREEA